MRKESFIKWLKNNTSLSPSTIDKYSRAVSTLSDEYLNDTDLYNIVSYQEAYLIANDLIELNEFQEKNKRGHNMYSNALKQYLDYLKYNFK